MKQILVGSSSHELARVCGGIVGPGLSMPASPVDQPVCPIAVPLSLS